MKHLSQKQRSPSANVPTTEYASEERGHNGWTAGSRYSGT